MAKLRLTKSALTEQRRQLQLYRQLLPSLDLKRRQLTIEHERAKREHAALRAQLEGFEAGIGAEIPMLANTEIALSGLVRVTGLELVEENIVGTRVPRLEELSLEVAPYSLLAKPAWVDVLVERLRGAAETRMRVQVAAERERILARALRRITQRVNLFEKILIPEARANIQRIRIHLGDVERDAVVRSKIAKARTLAKARARSEEASAP